MQDQVALLQNWRCRLQQVAVSWTESWPSSPKAYRISARRKCVNIRSIPLESTICPRLCLAHYIVFDILSRGSESLMERPLAERKSILKQEQENELVTIID
jgi:hypothetical protein